MIMHFEKWAYKNWKTSFARKNIIEIQMKGPREFSSMMINKQPMCGATPVLVYERQKGNIYKAKVSVTIISLLHDFMKKHPNVIELDNISKSVVFHWFCKYDSNGFFRINVMFIRQFLSTCWWWTNLLENMWTPNKFSREINSDSICWVERNSHQRNVKCEQTETFGRGIVFVEFSYHTSCTFSNLQFSWTNGFSSS